MLRRRVLPLAGALLFANACGPAAPEAAVVVAPPAAKNVFGDAAIGEYFRVFITYGVIALALVMHAWSNIQSRKPRNAIRNAGKA